MTPPRGGGSGGPRRPGGAGGGRRGPGGPGGGPRGPGGGRGPGGPGGRGGSGGSRGPGGPGGPGGRSGASRGPGGFGGGRDDDRGRGGYGGQRRDRDDPSRGPGPRRDRDRDDLGRGPGPVGGSGRSGASERSPGPRGRDDAPAPNDRLVYGRNPVRELLRAGRRTVHMVYASEQVASAPWLAAAPVSVSSSDRLAELAGTHDHQGIVAECDHYPYAELGELIGKPGVIVVLDEITDPRNVGAIARSAEATGALGLVIPERRAAQVTATVCKTSAGAIEHLKVAQVRNLADALAEFKAAGAWTYGAAMGGTPVADLDLTGSVVLVLGGEGKGLRPRVAASCDSLVSLPMVGKVDSLNVSAAAAVLLYAAFTAQHP